MEYRGGITGWYNVISGDLRALNLYGTWTPQGIPEAAGGGVELYGCADWTVVKGSFDRARGVWRCTGDALDPCNIIAYRNGTLRTQGVDGVRFFYLDGRLDGRVREALRSCRDFLDYYNGGLFRRRELETLDVALLSPAVEPQGAYQRAGLTVAGELDADPVQSRVVFGHELAHLWASGADTDTWEDWLNETFATWAELLYALDCGDGELFRETLRLRLEGCDGYPPIRTPDGSRPQGVHTKGVALLNGIYRSHGTEAIRLILQTFDGLAAGKRDTRALLGQLRQSGAAEIAREIESGLVR